MNEIRLNKLSPGGRGRPSPGPATALVGPTGASAPSRALVAVSSPSAADATRPGRAALARASAAFLAQVIATAQQAPQTRRRRRAEPDHACARYRAAADGRDVGRLLSRVL